MRILYLDPFHGGSHAAVAEGYVRHSQHDITLLALSIAGGWRWRMRGAAVTFARRLREHVREQHVTYDMIIVTDMFDLSSFLGLTRDLTAGVPVALYFHENQLTYPLPPGRARDLAFPWINYTSAVAADALCFNSDFHRRAFLEALPTLLSRFHDHQELELIDVIAAKSGVLAPGIDLARLDTSGDGGLNFSHPPSVTPPCAALVPHPPVILWNSRWEYDKGPQAFFDALRELAARGLDFRVIVAGEHIDPNEPNFLAARAWLGPRVLAWGYAPDQEAYRAMLRLSDIVVSTAIQEFFGISVIEALYCGCVPVLPRRLSYPELLPVEHHAACLYADDGALADRLAATIRDLPALKQRNFRAIAQQYDWSRMAPQWDALFEGLSKNNVYPH
jgi:glycosyltransferase involved in cell wall biosynthesis